MGGVRPTLGAMELFDWIRDVLNRQSKRPLFVGLSAPQGAGKTTAARRICELARLDGLSSVSISIDDFYLTRRDQTALAARNPDSPYLQARGYPLTHDIGLGMKTLESLQKHDRVGVSTMVPRYDKSAFGGHGDRLPKDQWTRIEGPVDLVILEGWMLGFKPVSRKELPNKHFLEINEALVEYEKWQTFLDALIWLEPDDIRFVVDWRVEAEERARSQGKSGLTTSEIKLYVEKFLVAYETYLPGLGERRSEVSDFLHLKIAIDRSLHE